MVHCRRPVICGVGYRYDSSIRLAPAAGCIVNIHRHGDLQDPRLAKTYCWRRRRVLVLPTSGEVSELEQ